MNTLVRIARLRRRLEELGAEGALITTRENVRYLTGFDGSAGTLVLGPGRAYLLTDNRYILKARATARGVRALEGKSPTEAINELPGRPVVVYEQGALTASALETLESGVRRARLAPERELVEPLRAVKDKHEVDLLREACRITARAWEAFQAEIRPGRTELELAACLDGIMRSLGASGPSFDSIIASGPNSAIPHHAPTDRLLREGDFLKCDFGALRDGYHADLTRTVVLGEPSERQREIYAAVHASHALAVSMLAPGVDGAKVVEAANRVITDAGFPRIPHGLGHGIGLRVHDAPGVGGGTVLAPGHVVTIEPGVYIEGLGGVRIEDSVLVTETGHEILTRCWNPAELSNPSDLVEEAQR